MLKCVLEIYWKFVRLDWQIVDIFVTKQYNLVLAEDVDAMQLAR